MTDSELDYAWSSHFGKTGSFADDKEKLDLTTLTPDQQKELGKVVAYHYPPSDSVFTFYMQILTIPNRVIMETLLKDIIK